MELTKLLTEDHNGGGVVQSPPSPGLFLRHKQKLALLSITALVLIVGMIDIWFGLVRNFGIDVHTVEISLQSNAQIDTMVAITGNMTSKSYMSSMTVEDNYCDLQYAEMGDVDAKWKDLGRIEGSFSQTFDDDKFGMTLALQDVSYSPVRHLLSNVIWRADTGASIQCRVGVTVHLYKLIPLRLYADIKATVLTSDDVTTLRYFSSGISGTSAFKFSGEVVVEGKEGDDSFNNSPLLHLLKSSFAKVQEVVSVFGCTANINHFIPSGIHTSTKNPLQGPFQSLDSFIVKVPELSAAVTLRGGEEGGGRYHLSSTAFQLQLAQPVVQVDVDFSLLCSNSFDPVHPETSELSPCNAIYADGLQGLWQDLSAGKLQVAIDSASPRNFLSSLAGNSHQLVAERSQLQDVESSIEDRLRSQDRSRERRALYVVKDPRISSGGECISLTADNVYDAYTCAVVEKGFFKLYVYAFDEDGLLTKVQLLTSWATTAPFAAATEALMLVRGGYSGEWNSTVSELFQNATTSLRYNDNGETKLRAEALAQWSLLNAVEEGSVDFTTYIESGSEKADVVLNFAYGENMYATSGAATYHDASSENSVRAVAEGGYGGDLSSWWLSLNDSAVFLNRDKQGDARGFVSSMVSGSGDEAAFVLNVLANDGEEVEQFCTRNNVSWASPTTWTGSGALAANSFLNIIDTLSWDAHGHVEYADNTYRALVSEYTKNGDEQLWGFANGRYEGTWTDWLVSIEESGLWWEMSKLGSALGVLTSAVNAAGTAGDLALSGSVLDAANIRFINTTDKAKWLSDCDDWLQAGKLQVSSLFAYPAVAQWNTTGLLDYADYAYKVGAMDYSGNGDKLFDLFGVGAYGGSDLLHWWASLTDSAVYTNSEKVGDAVGFISSMIANSGVEGDLSFYTAVRDGGGAQQVLTNNSAAWYSPSQQWTSSGFLTATSEFQLVNSGVNWDAWGMGEYGGDVYTLRVKDVDTSGASELDVFATGTYSGSWYSWQASLDDSCLFFSGNKVGSATGNVSSTVSPSGDDATLAFFGVVLDGESVEQVRTSEACSWDVSAEAGSLSASSFFVQAGEPIWNAKGDLNYGDHAYTFSAEDAVQYPDYVFLANGTGRYGGNLNSWWASLTQSSLIVDNQLLGTATGYISSDATASFDAGHVTFTALAFDGSDVPVMELFTNNIVTWTSPTGDWLSTGNLTVTSTMQVETMVEWDARGSVSFDHGNYSVYVSDNELDGQPVFLALAHGQYKGAWGHWALSVTESVCYINDAKQGSLTASLEWLNANSFETVNGMFTTTVLGASDQPVFFTNDRVEWFYWNDHAEGTLFTETDVSGNPEFMLLSQFALNQNNQTAALSVLETLHGELGLNASATAFYDTRYGMLTGIDATVFYDHDLIFQAHTAFDAQLQTLNTAMPTVSPTASPRPSVMPTRSPTMDASSNQQVTFYSNLTFSGLASANLDSNSQQCIVATSAEAMQISTDEVTFVGAVSIQDPVAASQPLRSPHAHLSSTGLVQVTIFTHVPLAGQPYPSADSLYDALTSTLNTSIADGSYQSLLESNEQTYQASQLTSAAATKVASSPPAVNAIPSSAPSAQPTVGPGGDSSSGSSDMNETTIAIIVVVVVVVLAAAAVLLYYWFFWRKSEPLLASGAAASSSPSVEMGDKA